MFEKFDRIWQIAVGVLGFFSLTWLFDLLTFKRRIKKDELQFLKDQFETSVSQCNEIKKVMETRIDLIKIEIEELKKNVCFKQDCPTRRKK